VSDAASIRFDHVTCAYDRKVAVDDVTLDVSPASFMVIVGPSGCGKTTLLKTVNRLVEPSRGSVAINGVDVRTVSATALRRGIGYVIQQIGLFPHMTVAENVGVVPSLLGWPRERIAQRVHEMLDLVHLPAEQFAARMPAKLSGGQQQRVGIARALAADPDILLMDEPFGALDAIERARLQTEVARLQRRLRRTILFVTHDVDEALRLADSIVVMREGRVVQHDRPIAVLSKPADSFVADLVDASDLVRRLGVLKVGDAALDPPFAVDGGAPLAASVRLDDDLRTALSAMLAAGSLRVQVLDPANNAAGVLTLERMLEAARTAAR
jgi:osmoprotectant transport system ATP-binding protein